MAKRQRKGNPSGITPNLDAYAKRIGAKCKNFRTYVVEEEERGPEGRDSYGNPTRISSIIFVSHVTNGSSRHLRKQVNDQLLLGIWSMLLNY